VSPGGAGAARGRLRALRAARRPGRAPLTFAGCPPRASTLEIEQRLPDMDLVIGAVLVHGEPVAGATGLPYTPLFDALEESAPA
jgi:hypothetical protein